MLLKSGELLRQPCNLGKLQKVRKTSFYMVPILASSIHGPFLQITEAFPLKAVSEAVGDVLILFLGRTVIPEIAMDLSYLHAKFAKGSRGAFWGLQYTGFFFFFLSKQSFYFMLVLSCARLGSVSPGVQSRCLSTSQSSDLLSTDQGLLIAATASFFHFAKGCRSNRKDNSLQK